MQPQTRKAVTVPLYNVYGVLIGNIPLDQAKELHGALLDLRFKGNGRRRRYTSARLYAITMLKWAIRSSGGFSVLQLVSE
jgi:hypothetical protein